VLIGSGVAVFALPFIFVTNGSLFSKLLPQHIQGVYDLCSYVHNTCATPVGFGQGLQWSVGAVAAILGPLWAGATLHMYHVLMGVPLGILTGVMVSWLEAKMVQTVLFTSSVGANSGLLFTSQRTFK